MAKLPSQIKTQKNIEMIAQNHGYKVTLRKKDPKSTTSVKKFLPDVVAAPFKGAARHVFEVEATVTNNTIFKSLASLAYFLTQHEGEAFLIVPAKHIKFAQGCLDAHKAIIRRFGKVTKGANPKTHIEVITFEQVAADERKVARWDANGRKGQPPKCKYLPRPR